MTILPKKKAEQESDSDGDHSTGSPHNASPHGAAGHPPLSSPNSPEEVGYHSPDGFYHRRYDLSSSSGESSPELPSLSKRTSYRSSPSATASGTRGKKPLDSSPGYNSSEEYDGSRRPYADPERERQFETLLKKERGWIIKKMRPDGACLFRAVADQVYGDQEMHIVVRNQCMDYMLKNADYFSQYISDEDFEHYINRKRLDHCYGNNIEMQAIAEMYNRPIEVYQYTTEPINIFFGVYKTDNAPIRLSYHGCIHYNSVIDPYKATIGVGLGLAGHKPGYADKTQVSEAQRDSENVHIEQTMLEDKMRSTDWEATCDAIEEAVVRESYLTWLRENEKRTQPGKHAGSQPSSSACRGSSPPVPSSSSSSQTITITTTIATTTTTITTLSGPSPANTSSARKLSTLANNHRGTSSSSSSTSSIVHTTCKPAEPKMVKPRSLVLSHVTGTGSPNSTHHHHRGSSLRRFTPSPPSSTHHRGGNGLGAGTGAGGNSAVRNAPYYSPRDSPRNTSGGYLRGSARNSSHYSKDSTRKNSGTGSLRGSARNSPNGSPRNSIHGTGSVSPPCIGDNTSSLYQHDSSSSENSPNRSPVSTRRPLLVNLNESNHLSLSHSPRPGSSNNDIILNLPSTEPSSNSLLMERTQSLSPYEGSSSSKAPPLPSPPSPLPPTGSQSPPHTLNFEDGRVLSQLPYEYSSFLDLPPSALGESRDMQM